MHENEIWKPIIIQKNEVTYDYTGLYEVSNLGRVRSCDRVDSRGRKLKGKIMERKPHKNGYVYVGLHKDGECERFRVHRLVATAFIPNPDNLPDVNHKNELKSDNVWTNLEWVTVQYNTQYSSYKWKGENHHMYGKPSPLKGKPLTEEHKRKISESKKGSKNYRAIKIVCLETGEVFGCVKEAEEWLGKTGIYHCLKGRAKTCGGYHWTHYSD